MDDRVTRRPVELTIGRGLDDLIFGSSESRVVDSLGAPDKLFTGDDGDHRLRYTYRDSWLELQFEYGRLCEICIGHLFDVNDEPVWPTA